MLQRFKKVGAMALVGFAVLALAACGQSSKAATTDAGAQVSVASEQNSASTNAAAAPDNVLTPDNAVISIFTQEMTFKPSSASAPAGQVTFIVINQGKLNHEVVILKTDKAASTLPISSSGNKVDEAAAGNHVGEIEVAAGQTGAGTFLLRPGKYVLICNIDGHYQAGMAVPFTVTGTVANEQDQAAPTMPAAAAAPVASGDRKEIAVIKAVRPNLVNTIDALKANDIPAAKKAFAAYDAAWNGVEVYVNYRSAQLYADLETDLQAKIQKALDDPASKAEDIRPLVEQELGKWDDAIKLVSTGPAISPLFDDVATLRMLRAATIRPAAPLLKAGDAATAAPMLQDFINRWADVEDLIHERSIDAYAQTEDAMGKMNAALQKSTPDAAELAAIVATVTNRFNYGLGFVNAAARGSDLAKTTFTADDVQAAAALGNMSAELKASLASWQSGSYADAASHAKKANDLFAKLTPALTAKKGNTAAVQKALDAYIALADKAGDASAVRAANVAVAELVPISQQWFVGQFWGDPKLQDAIAAAMKTQ